MRGSVAIVAALIATTTAFASDTGQLYGYGLANEGQLGSGDRAASSSPVFVADDVVEVVAGEFHTFFFKSDGSLWAMGDNDFGQLGLGDNTDRLSPVKLSDEVLAASAGRAHSLLILPGGDLWAVGRNEDGELGLGDFLSRNLPEYVASNVVAVAAGDSYSLFLTGEGSVYAMGDNLDSTAGLRGRAGFDADFVNVPTKVAEDMARIEASLNHSLLLGENGVLYGMGHGEPLGVGSNWPEPTALSVGVVDMAAGGRHSIWVNESGDLLGAGYNGVGQLGPDVPANSPGLHLIDEGGNLAVATGWDFSLVSRRLLESDNRGLLGFGVNSFGQLGDSADPQPVLIAEDVFDSFGSMDAGGGTTFVLTPWESSVAPFGRLLAVRNRVFDSGSLGRLHFRFPSQVDLPEIEGVDQEFRQAWSESLGSLLTADSANLTSPEYGNLTRGEDLGWVHSEYFGWTYSGRDGNELDGWVSSERFGWMRFLGEETGDNLLWVAEWETWISVQEDGSFYSFDFGPLRPLSMESYASPHFETVFVGDYGGWFLSTRFGWVWVARETGGEWFYSEARGEWLAITSEGGIWSTAEGRFL